MSFTAKGEAAAASPAAAAAAAALADAAPAGGWRAVLAAFPLGPVLVNPLTLIKSPRFWRSVVGEFVATAMFLAVTVGVVISGNYDTAIVDATTTVALAGAMTPARHLIIALTFGLMITVLVYIFAPISGANINPAVTITLVVSKALDPFTGFFYILAQCLGAMAGCGLVKAIHSDAYSTYGGGANGVSPSFGAGGALLAETLATFLLCFTVLAAVDGGVKEHTPYALQGDADPDARYVRPANGAVLAFPIGFAVFLAHLWLVPIDGTSINPARSFGAAVVFNKWDDHYVFWLGPIMGESFDLIARALSLSLALFISFLFAHVSAPSFSCFLSSPPFRPDLSLFLSLSLTHSHSHSHPGGVLAAFVYQVLFNEHWLVFLEEGPIASTGASAQRAAQRENGFASRLDDATTDATQDGGVELTASE